RLHHLTLCGWLATLRRGIPLRWRLDAAEEDLSAQVAPDDPELLQDTPGGVLATKLARPRVPPSFLPRPRLRRLFNEGAAVRLTVVSAGAGWGKTLAAADWAHDPAGSRRLACLSLDAGDD